MELNGVNNQALDGQLSFTIHYYVPKEIDFFTLDTLAFNCLLMN
jgi:hypothetical protein